MKILHATLIGVLVGFGAFANAATITIVNVNAPGVGFNDPTPATPFAGNNGTTLGQQRLNVFQAAANRWGRILKSNVEIRIRGSMAPQTCSGTSAVLGSAGTLNAFADFPNAPFPNVAYSSALANALSGSDLDPASEDLVAIFNVDIDNPTAFMGGPCLTGTAGWHYGTDSAIAVPANRTPLLPVVFHEIAHGLGFQSLISNTTGNYSTGAAEPIWARFLFDNSTGKFWNQMTPAERLASAVNDPNLVWNGPRVTAAQGNFLKKPPAVIINLPLAIASSNAAQTASFGAQVTAAGLTRDVVAALDSGGAATTDACETITNAAEVTGKIALVDRGTCTFVVKAVNAQAAGAVGLIVANNTASGLPGMGGSDATVTLVALGVTQALGTSIRANLPGVNATLGIDQSQPLAGTNNGRVRMNGPNPIVQGSSVSHWTPDAFPNLLMEPALNTSIFNRVDLTNELFLEIGWPVEEIHYDGFE